jgi:hypothetical protein
MAQAALRAKVTQQTRANMRRAYKILGVQPTTTDLDAAGQAPTNLANTTHLANMVSRQQELSLGLVLTQDAMCTLKELAAADPVVQVHLSTSKQDGEEHLQLRLLVTDACINLVDVAQLDHRLMGAVQPLLTQAEQLYTMTLETLNHQASAEVVRQAGDE